jgi:hypothetical protein
MQPADQPADSKAQICALEFRCLTAAAGSKKSRWAWLPSHSRAQADSRFYRCPSQPCSAGANNSSTGVRWIATAAEALPPPACHRPPM